MFREYTRAMKATVAAVLAIACAACGGGGSPLSPSVTPPVSGGIAGEVQLANEGWVHVPEGTAVTYRSNPPASGPHYPVWARYQEYPAAVERPYWVHNLEHGAIVLLYRPDAAPATIAALANVFRALPADPECGHARALLTPDPLLPRQVAAVAADWLWMADAVDPAAIQAFTLAHRNHAPEDICASGTR